LIEKFDRGFNASIQSVATGEEVDMNTENWTAGSTHQPIPIK
jgi:hypothetical protein